MVDYDIRRSQRRCSVTDRAFEPGEQYISALFETDDGYQRLDFSNDQWQETPEDCIGWWKSTIPQKNQNRVYWAPNDVLIAYFDHLFTHEPNSTTTYVMGIALVRRKILRMEPNEKMDGLTWMVLESSNREKQYRIPVQEPSSSELKTIQQELNEQLFTDHAPET